MSSGIVTCYALLLCAVITGFAIYDIRERRVPNKALAFFLPIFMTAPVLYACHVSPVTAFWPSFGGELLSAALGAVVGFGILLTAALLSRGGCGVGGGDIKLTAAMGFAYGPYGILGILLIASLLCAPVAALYSRKSKGAALHLPFVPFLAVGSFTLTAIQIIF